MQSRGMSLVESFTNIVVGATVAVLLQIVIYQFLVPEVTTYLIITAILTLAALARGYFVRRFFNWLQEWLKHPHFVIGDHYLHRWFVIPRNPFLNVYLHEIRRSDDDRALHDHPWWSFSICLKGHMSEVMKSEVLHLGPGDMRLRSAKLAHRLEIFGEPCWTLFITGPRIRQWGFHCPKGWVHWKVFTGYFETGDSSQVGRGCG